MDIPLTSTDQNAPDAKEGKARVSFSPSRQVLHGATTMSVLIEDPEGVQGDFRLKVNYNGQDVTGQFLKNAEWTRLDPIGHQVKITTKHFRLIPMRDNKITVSYRHDPQVKAVVAHLLPPMCSAFAERPKMILTLPGFEPNPTLIQLINNHALKRSFNPYLVAGLVAQESRFDSRALSRRKALGLTQVTSQGEGEILKSFAHWPRYPELKDMPLALLKLAIMSGRIHEGNEWRLDPSLSIQGGVEYLKYLSEYWSRPDKRSQIEKNLGPTETTLSEVMLASYNSGAARVSDALERRGSEWLQDEELTEAKNYVSRVVSYCDHFEHQED